MNPRGHRCGGVLAPGEVIVLDTHPPFTFAFRVPGFICAGCHEELIDRDTAVAVWQSQLPASVWNAPSATSKGA